MTEHTYSAEDYQEIGELLHVVFQCTQDLRLRRCSGRENGQRIERLAFDFTVNGTENEYYAQSDNFRSSLEQLADFMLNEKNETKKNN